MKSTSDLMINMGLSYDVIAFDVCVVNYLCEKMAYNRTAPKMQANVAQYLSVESELRVVCKDLGSNLATLDRVCGIGSGALACSNVFLARMLHNQNDLKRLA